MPRKSNQTQYDDMMSVFKQSQRSETRAHRNSQANPTTRVADTRHAQLPRSHTPHPAQMPVRATDAFAGFAVQAQAVHPSSGCVSPQAWEEPYATSSPTYPSMNPHDNRYSNRAYEAMQSYDAPSATMSSPAASQMPYALSSQWVVQFNLDGQNQRQYALPIERFQVPQAQCPCGTRVRILHLPSIVNWQPPFGVLWNFKKNSSNAWIEGTARSDCVSAAKCPACQAQITLHGPTSTNSTAQRV